MRRYLILKCRESLRAYINIDEHTSYFNALSVSSQRTSRGVERGRSTHATAWDLSNTCLGTSGTERSRSPAVRSERRRNAQKVRRIMGRHTHACYGLFRIVHTNVGTCNAVSVAFQELVGLLKKHCKTAAAADVLLANQTVLQANGKIMAFSVQSAWTQKAKQYKKELELKASADRTSVSNTALAICATMSKKVAGIDYPGYMALYQELMTK